MALSRWDGGLRRAGALPRVAAWARCRDNPLAAGQLAAAVLFGSTAHAEDSRRRYREMVTYERITTDPAVMGGLPCIRGLRFPVATVLAMLADGMATEDILAEHPRASPRRRAGPDLRRHRLRRPPRPLPGQQPVSDPHPPARRAQSRGTGSNHPRQPRPGHRRPHDRGDGRHPRGHAPSAAPSHLAEKSQVASWKKLANQAAAPLLAKARRTPIWRGPRGDRGPCRGSQSAQLWHRRTPAGTGPGSLRQLPGVGWDRAAESSGWPVTILSWCCGAAVRKPGCHRDGSGRSRIRR
jgi:uncharacterized protein (DUF433 family)